MKIKGNYLSFLNAIKIVITKNKPINQIFKFQQF